MGGISVVMGLRGGGCKRRAANGDIARSHDGIPIGGIAPKTTTAACWCSAAVASTAETANQSPEATLLGGVW